MSLAGCRLEGSALPPSPAASRQGLPSGGARHDTEGAAASPAPASAPEPSLANATVTLVLATCERDDWAVMRERERWGVYADAFMGVAAHSCGDGSVFAPVDDLGRLGAPKSSNYPAKFEGYAHPGSTRIGEERWVARSNDVPDRPGVAPDERLTFLVGALGSWQVAGVLSRPFPHARLAGFGAWPGGAVIAAFEPRWDGVGSAPDVEVVRGTPTQPLPIIGNVGTPFYFATVPEGEAFGVWPHDGRDGGLVFLHWKRGETKPVAQVFPWVELSTDARSLVVRSATEVYLPVIATDDAKRTVRILRFDGTRWRTSLIVENGYSPLTLAAGPDGAMWLLLTAQGLWSEVWRQPPGAKDSWQRVAERDLGPGAPLQATSLLPFRGGALFAGRLDGNMLGFYRIDLPPGTH
jgi:hypothetical protein